jgi:alpha-tubulin suppressor-like RCC1 family protein
VLLVFLIGCRDEADSPTAPQSGPALAAAAVSGLSFVQVSTGQSYSCGVTVDSLAYCWGLNSFGQLGDGTKNNSLSPVRVAGQK